MASPNPLRIVELEPIRWLLERDCVVVCAGGGGIPVVRRSGGEQVFGVPAVIDKDLASSLLARQLGADLFVMATDVDGVYQGWGTPAHRKIDLADPEISAAEILESGSMGPKVEAACAFVAATGKSAVIGSLDQLERLVKGSAGTVIAPRLPASALRSALI